MWYSRKFAPLIAIAVAIGTAVALWIKPNIEAYTSSASARILLHLSPATLVFLGLFWLNIRLIYRFGAHELKERLKAQWTERILARVENRDIQHRFDDILDYVAFSEVCYAKMTYALCLWDWKEDED